MNIKLFVIIIIVFLLNNTSEAKINKKNKLATDRYASLVVNYPSCNVLHQQHADKVRHPASLTKMMTIYLTFEAIKMKRLSFNQELLVSPHAAKTPYSNFVKIGEKISVKDLVMAAIVKSANDASVVLGEKLAGNEYEFAKMMTKKARQLNMNNTVFKNSHGLHHFAQKTTAIDMAKLAIALYRDFPEYYHLFSKTSFIYKNKIYQGHNRILKNYPGATGLKTGFIDKSGFNIVTTAKRDNTTLVVVVMGGKTAEIRDGKAIKLLDLYFQDIKMNAQLSKTAHQLIANKKSYRSSK